MIILKEKSKLLLPALKKGTFTFKKICFKKTFLTNFQLNV